MSCGVVSYIICMFYNLCKIVVIVRINKFICFSYIINIISVTGIMLISNNIISKIMICLLYIVRFYLSYVNNIPHGHALFRRIMVQSCDTWYAVRTVEHVILQYLRPFGLEFGLERRIYMRQPATCALEPNALVPDRLRGRKPAGRPMDVF